MTSSVLELHEVRRIFPGYELGPLTLRCQSGRVYGLLGPNGAGKTTLLDLIALQLKATSGGLGTRGQRVAWGDRAWKARLSYIRETPSFYEELTIAQTLALAARLYGDWNQQRANRLVSQLGLQPDRQVGPLSKGTKVKLGLVTALAHHADLLLLDEPTAGLDPTARAELLRAIGDLLRDQPSLCVVLSSHIFEDIEAAATDILVLRRGRLAFDASAEALRASVLYRTDAVGSVAASTDLLLRWTRHDTQWLLVRRGSSLEADLRLRSDHLRERPRSLLAAVYHGTEHADAD